MWATVLTRVAVILRGIATGQTMGWILLLVLVPVVSTVGYRGVMDQQPTAKMSR
jgi:hypothetical protein